MTKSMIYVVALVAIYLNGLLTFHLMPLLQQTGHPNLYAVFLFPLSGVLLLLLLFIAYGLLKGLPLWGGMGLFRAEHRHIALAFALVVAVAASHAGYGMPVLSAALLSIAGFALVFLGVEQMLK